MRLKRGPSDLVAVDIASTAVKVVRVKRVQAGAATLVAAAVLPPISMKEEGQPGEKKLTLAKNLMGKHLSLTVPGRNAIVKLLTFMGKMEDTSESQIMQLMGIEKAENYRISYKIITAGSARTESRVLTVALPEVEAQTALKLFPSGLPAPYSLEISGLSTISSYLHGPGVKHEAEAVGVVDFGAESTFFVLLNKNAVSLVRKFDIGANTILTKVQKSLGVDHETALGIISDGSFNLSQIISEVMDPFVKQLIISRDFVERRENCHVVHVYVTGGITESRDWIGELHKGLSLPVDTWNPLDGLVILPGAVPENLKGHESQFAAAMGAVHASFEEP